MAPTSGPGGRPGPRPRRGDEPQSGVRLSAVPASCDQNATKNEPLTCVPAGQGLKSGEPACTPDSVVGASRHPRRPSLSAGGYPPAPAAYPGVFGGRATHPPVWPCSGWGLHSRPGHPGRWCALTAPLHPCLCAVGPFHRPARAIGGLLSVALSFGSPRLGVTQHPALRSPDVPRTGHAGTRPPGRLTTTASVPGRCRAVLGRIRGFAAREWPVRAIPGLGVTPHTGPRMPPPPRRPRSRKRRR